MAIVMFCGPLFLGTRYLPEPCAELTAAMAWMRWEFTAPHRHFSNDYCQDGNGFVFRYCFAVLPRSAGLVGVWRDGDGDWCQAVSGGSKWGDDKDTSFVSVSVAVLLLKLKNTAAGWGWCSENKRWSNFLKWREWKKMTALNWRLLL